MTMVKYSACSSNTKLGPMPASMTSRATCSPDCPFKGNGCYADNFPLSLHWDRLSEGLDASAITWDDYLTRLYDLPAGTLTRAFQAGDFPGYGGKLHAESVIDFALASAHLEMICFTHYRVTGDDEVARHNRSVLRLAREIGVTITLSANSLEHADELSALELGPVASVVPHDTHTDKVTRTPGGLRAVTCPATYRDTTCLDCGICAQKDHPIIAFPAHGNRKARASSIARIPVVAA